MTFDSALSWINLALFTSLLGLLIWRRVYRVLPMFVAYQIYSILFSIPTMLHTSDTPGYILLWSVGIIIDTFFFLWVSIELGRSVLRFNGALQWPEGVFLLLFSAAAIPIAVLVRWQIPTTWNLLWHFEFRVMQTSAVIETATLLTLAWWTALRSLRWPDCELRLIMGLGGWALAQMVVLIAHEHGFVGIPYRWIDFLMPLSVLGMLMYWLHYFWLTPGSFQPDLIGRPNDSAIRETEKVGSGEPMRLAKR